MEETLYDAICKAGITTDYHESDLYFPVTEKSTAILAQFPQEAKNATTFAENRSGAPWYDVPFAYTPFWDAKVRTI
jgi:hypothetical protein